MYPRALEFLVCPLCYEPLECKVFSEIKDDVAPRIKEGLLLCSRCGSNYPIDNFIPRFVERAPTPDRTDRRTFNPSLLETKDRNTKTFGYEWQRWNKLGWESETNRSRVQFEQKALAEENEFEGKLVLDAGCGNGRFTYQASSFGGEIFAIDINEAIQIAYENLKWLPNVHVVNADIFYLPFKPKIFDRIFSVGVLMHTGNAQCAFNELVKLLKPGSFISVHVYRKGNAIYELIDKTLRSVTTRMGLDRLRRMSEIIEAFPKGVHALRHLTFGEPYLYSLMNCFVRLEANQHCIFDWYAAPVASHHTYPEVFGWFEEAGLKIVKHNYKQRDYIRRILQSTASGVTVKGVLP